ncbi:MAG: metal-dependent hydrolase [Halolamina sp.]
MYRTGHLGVSLLVFAPIGYLLVAAGSPLAALVTGGAMLWLAMLPDVDHRLPLISHRGPTHSLLFAVLIGGAFGGAGLLLEEVGAGGAVAELLGLAAFPGVGLPAFGFAVGFSAIAAHLLGDVLTPAGVNLFWPASREYSLYITRADNTLANYGLFLLGLFAVAAAGVLALQGAPA